MMNHSDAYVFIHSVIFLARGSQSPPKRLFHQGRSSTSAFNFQYPPSSLRSSSSCLRLLPPRHFYPSLYLFFNNVFRRQFLCKMWPMQLPFLSTLRVLYVGYSFPLWLYVTRLNFSHARSNWSSSFLCSATFQHFPVISQRRFQMSNYQHRTN
jgi:hypothetical protein